MSRRFDRGVQYVDYENPFAREFRAVHKEDLKVILKALVRCE